jgi:hypothetical protein
VGDSGVPAALVVDSVVQAPCRSPLMPHSHSRVRVSVPVPVPAPAPDLTQSVTSMQLNPAAPAVVEVVVVGLVEDSAVAVVDSEVDSVGREFRSSATCSTPFSISSTPSSRSAQARSADRSISALMSLLNQVGQEVVVGAEAVAVVPAEGSAVAVEDSVAAVAVSAVDAVASAAQDQSVACSMTFSSLPSTQESWTTRWTTRTTTQRRSPSLPADPDSQAPRHLRVPLQLQRPLAKPPLHLPLPLPLPLPQPPPPPLLLRQPSAPSTLLRPRSPAVPEAQESAA